MTKIKSYAKVNINLHVFQLKKNEKLHKIKSVFLLHKQLFDIVEIEDNQRITQVTFEGNWKINNKRNTITKCIEVFKKHTEINPKLKVKVIKKIPPGSGLGGGSSNAAAVLSFLANKYNIKNEIVKKIAFETGSDVLFFITNFDCALVEGYGEKIRKAKSNFKIKKIIFNKEICLTKDVYKKFDDLAFKKVNFSSKEGQLYNALLRPCFLLYPTLQKKYAKIGKKFTVVLSGSGSSFVVLE